MVKKVSRRKERQRRQTFTLQHEGTKKSFLSCCIANKLELDRLKNESKVK